MRSGVVIAGVILMVVGLFFLSFMGVMWESYGGLEDGGVGFFFPQIIGLGLIGLGFIVFIAGLAASPVIRTEPRTVRPQIVTPPSPAPTPTILAICPQCKSRIPAESKFCPECGTNLQPKKTAKKRAKPKAK